MTRDGIALNSQSLLPRSASPCFPLHISKEWHTLLFLLFHAFAFSILSFLLLFFFSPFALFLQAHLLPSLPPALSRFIAGLLGSITAMSTVSLFIASANIFYSSMLLHWEMAQRMLASVTDWSTVKTTLDIGCGLGILLNSVALMLKKQGSSRRVVGLDDHQRRKTLAMLRTPGIEGVQEYVTCQEGNARRLPFADNYFDVVVSGVHLHTEGRRLQLRREGRHWWRW